MSIVKKLITIKTEDPNEAGDVMLSIHSQLTGNKDYIDSNIVLNDSGTRNDGTENEIRVYFFEECINIPELKL